MAWYLDPNLSSQHKKHPHHQSVPGFESAGAWVPQSLAQHAPFDKVAPLAARPWHNQRARVPQGIQGSALQVSKENGRCNKCGQTPSFVCVFLNWKWAKMLAHWNSYYRIPPISGLYKYIMIWMGRMMIDHCILGLTQTCLWQANHHLEFIWTMVNTRVWLVFTICTWLSRTNGSISIAQFLIARGQ